jgi:hypothetical protein
MRVAAFQPCLWPLLLLGTWWFSVHLSPTFEKISRVTLHVPISVPALPVAVASAWNMVVLCAFVTNI